MCTVCIPGQRGAAVRVLPGCRMPPAAQNGPTRCPGVTRDKRQITILRGPNAPIRSCPPRNCARRAVPVSARRRVRLRQLRAAREGGLVGMQAEAGRAGFPLAFPRRAGGGPLCWPHPARTSPEGVRIRCRPRTRRRMRIRQLPLRRGEPPVHAARGVRAVPARGDRAQRREALAGIPPRFRGRRSRVCRSGGRVCRSGGRVCRSGGRIWRSGGRVCRSGGRVRLRGGCIDRCQDRVDPSAGCPGPGDPLRESPQAGGSRGMGGRWPCTCLISHGPSIRDG